MSTIVKLKRIIEYLNISKIAVESDINKYTLYSKLRNITDFTEQQRNGIFAVLTEVRDLINELLKEK